MLNLTVIILVHNEEMHIERVIDNVTRIAKEILVIDSFSTDKTVELACAAGAKVFQHEFIHQAQQLQWALDGLPIEGDWLLRLDADEILTEALIAEIQEKLPLLSPDVTGVTMTRRQMFMGRWIKHGGRYPLKLLRLWRKDAARIEQRWMDEHTVLLHGRSVHFQHDFCDDNRNDLRFFMAKHCKYASREAIERLNRTYELFERDIAVESGAGGAQARIL